MSKLREMTPVELHEEGIRALINRLGVSGMIQFIGLYYMGTGDFTRDRHKLHPNETIDDIVARIKKRRAAKKRKPVARTRS